MKKIPTLFEREYENHKVIGIKPIVTPGMEWVLNDEGYATVKIDGSCCAVFGGTLFMMLRRERSHRRVLSLASLPLTL